MGNNETIGSKLQKRELLRIEAVVPLLTFNFETIPTATRKSLLMDMVAYVGLGVAESQRESQQLITHMEDLISKSKQLANSPSKDAQVTIRGNTAAVNTALTTTTVASQAINSQATTVQHQY